MPPNRADDLAARLRVLEDRVAAACTAAGRARREVTLIAVSKTCPASDVAVLRELGVRDFGENRDQEAAAKAAQVRGVRWHFVGQLQTNKAASVAAYADVVHSLDRPRLAHALSAGATRAARRLDVLVQVSVDGDAARGGALPEDVPALADLAARLDGLRLAGVMAVAPLGSGPGAPGAADAFARLAAVSAALRREHPEASAVSAGMSGDLEQAVAAGATHLRVGTALFGPRPPLLR